MSASARAVSCPPTSTTTQPHRLASTASPSKQPCPQRLVRPLLSWLRPGFSRKITASPPPTILNLTQFPQPPATSPHRLSGTRFPSSTTSLTESPTEDSPHRPPSPSSLQAAPPIRFPPAQKWFLRSEKPAALDPPSARVDRSLIEVYLAKSGPEVDGPRPTASKEARFPDKEPQRPPATLFHTPCAVPTDPASVQKKTQSAEISPPPHHPLQKTKVNHPPPPPPHGYFIFLRLSRGKFACYERLKVPAICSVPKR